MSRPSLSIVPCPAYAPHDPTPRHERGCERCGHRVHDLSTMDEHQARRLLHAPSERLCVHARARRDGTLVLAGGRRSGRLRLGLAMGLTMGLAMGLTTMVACAPHVRNVELDLPGSLCEDIDGYEIPCESEIDAWLNTIPESSPSAMTEHASETSEPEGTTKPETDAPEQEHDVALEPERDDYELLGFVDEAYDATSEAEIQAEIQAEHERRLELERRARAAAGA
ncbi:MAG: hypothetical protein AAGF11_25540 [Myxococcota bacterium]